MGRAGYERDTNATVLTEKLRQRHVLQNRQQRYHQNARTQFGRHADEIIRLVAGSFALERRRPEIRQTGLHVT